MRLKDKVALITGGAAGIGKATAERFLASEDASFNTGAVLRVDGASLSAPEIKMKSLAF